MSVFRPNRNLERDLAATDEFKTGMREIAETVRKPAEAFARQIGAPWLPKRGSGHAQAVVVEQDEDGTRVVLAGHGAHLAEYGSANNPPHAPLRRGASAAGIRLTEDG